MPETKQITVDLPMILQALIEPLHTNYKTEVSVSVEVTLGGGENLPRWTVEFPALGGRLIGATFNEVTEKIQGGYEKKLRAAAMKAQAAQLLREAELLVSEPVEAEDAPVHAVELPSGKAMPKPAQSAPC